MRGDRPSQAEIKMLLAGFTPHARGSTLYWLLVWLLCSVYPACAGIDRVGYTEAEARRSLPRMRGDRPAASGPVHNGGQFTPHARGSTANGPASRAEGLVYPACAGIDL